MFWIPMAIGAGMNLLKNQGEQKRVQAMNQAAATQTAYAPISGMGMGKIQQAPSAMEAAMQGAASGAMIGQMGQQAGWWDMMNKNPQLGAGDLGGGV